MSNSSSGYPVVDIRYKVVKGLFGKKRVARSLTEQRMIKRRLLAENPNLIIIDDIDSRSSRDWIDELEEFDAIFDDM